MVKNRHLWTAAQRQTPVDSGTKTDTREQWPKTLWSVAKNRHLWTAAQRQTPVNSGQTETPDTCEQWPNTLWHVRGRKQTPVDSGTKTDTCGQWPKTDTCGQWPKTDTCGQRPKTPVNRGYSVPHAEPHELKISLICKSCPQSAAARPVVTDR